MDLGLKGRVAVVAAASKGLGRAAWNDIAGDGAIILLQCSGKCLKCCQ